MLYPTKAKLGYIFTLERQLRLRIRLCFYLAIFFIYLLIIYPACPARDEKSDDPPARVVAFSFVHDCPFGWDEPECPLSIFSGKNILTQNRALPHRERPALLHPLCKVEQIDQHDHGKAIVDHDRHQIVDRGDQRARSDCRVDMDLVEQHRDQRAHQTGNDHGHDQR